MQGTYDYYKSRNTHLFILIQLKNFQRVLNVCILLFKRGKSTDITLAAKANIILESFKVIQL